MIIGWKASNGRMRKGDPDLRDQTKRLVLDLRAESDYERAMLARLYYQSQEHSFGDKRIVDIKFTQRFVGPMPKSERGLEAASGDGE